MLAPWVFFLFVGVLDFGFYAYGLISVANAARTAVLYTSSDMETAKEEATNPVQSCQYVLRELRGLPNVGTSVTSCNADPVRIVVELVPAAASVNGFPASRVTVIYQTVSLIPIPGLMVGQLQIQRTVEMEI